VATVVNLLRGAIRMTAVSKVYASGGKPVHAIDRWSLDIGAGEFVAIVGPSGCGKTTLLKAIAGFESISSGQIVLDGRVVASSGSAGTPGPDRAVVFQRSALFPWMTVLQNVAFGFVMQRAHSAEESKVRAQALLGELDLSDIAGAYPGALSSGTLRRVEFVRALVNDPSVLLLDEPFRALDATTKEAMHEYLIDLLQKRRRTVLLVTHDIDEAVLLADRVVISTCRPARVKSTFAIELPHPRSAQSILGSDFAAYREAILDHVEQEAQAAFAAGEREGS
jgi:NitT/TauT family transport system ATP-binding protein